MFVRSSKHGHGYLKYLKRLDDILTYGLMLRLSKVFDIKISFKKFPEYIHFIKTMYIKRTYTTIH